MFLERKQSREELLAYRGLARVVVEDNGEERVLYNPTPRQDALHLCKAPNALFGGAAGGGKSHSLRWDAYMRCLSVPGYRALLLRRTYPELADTHIERVLLDCLVLGATYSKTEYKLRFPNGSVLQFGHCEDDQTISKYLSTEYDAIYFDEASTFEERHFLWISSRARSTKPGVVAIVRAGSNPGGTGSLWLKRRFIDKDIEPDEDPAYRPEDYEFIPSLLTDNPHIGDDYEKRLMALPSEALRRAYLHGEWDAFEGQEFAEWRARKNDEPWHVIDELPTINGKVITEIPWIEVFRAIDWGYSENGICGWYACMPDGGLLKFQEYVFKGVITSRVAKEINERSRGMKVRYTVADPAMWMKQGSLGESMAETFMKQRIFLIQADNDRINGWQRMHHYLTETVGYPERPLIQFWSKGCPYTIKTIPIMVSEPKKPGDIKTRGVEDHGADETRYALMSRPAPSVHRPRKIVVPGTVAWEVQQILREQARRQRLGAEAVRR
jgi:phage terminase large subunit